MQSVNLKSLEKFDDFKKTSIHTEVFPKLNMIWELITNLLLLKSFESVDTVRRTVVSFSSVYHIGPPRCISPPQIGIKSRLTRGFNGFHQGCLQVMTHSAILL